MPQYLNSFLIGVFFAIVIQQPVVAEEGLTVEELQQQLNCIDSVDDAITRLNTISGTWLNDPESSLNIEKNFNELTKLHAEYTSMVKALHNKALPDPNAPIAVGLELETIDSKHTDFTDKYEYISGADYRFMMGIADVMGGLEEVGEEVEGSKKQCGERFKDDIALIQKDIRTYQKYLLKINSYIVQAAKKRENLFSIVLLNRRFSIVDSYNKAQEEQLDRFARILDEPLLASKIRLDIENWWFQNHVPHISHGLITHYLQFNSGLNSLYSSLQELEEFKQRLNELTNIPLGQKDIILNEINNDKKVLEQNINDLKEQGWEGVIERQKFLSKVRLDIINEYPEKCKGAVTQYLSVVNEPIEHSRLEEYEQLYWQQVRICEDGIE